MKDKLPESNEKACVLLVDDKPENLRLLAETLSDRYRIQIARSGELAIRAVQDQLPDIVLLDVNMPGTDGFEVCHRLKDDPATRSIPIIFVTALAKSEEKIRGFQLGAVDYVTKPFQIDEVIARLETHLELKRLREELANKVEELEEKNDRLNLFANALAHDLRSPLTSVLGFSDLMLLSDSIDDESREYAELVNRSGQRINEIVESLLVLATAENTDSHLEEIALEGAFESAREGLAKMIDESSCRIRRAGTLPPAQGNSAWVERVWSNYLSNAIKYGGSPPEISVGANQTANGQIKCWVEDNGAGLQADQKAKLFTPFGRLHTKKAEGIGLGLVIVQKIVEQMGGRVGVEDGEHGGSRFYFTLPAPGEGEPCSGLQGGRFFEKQGIGLSS